ncbi:unnamed protein product, partial [Rotaria sp. Silwood1]
MFLVRYFRLLLILVYASINESHQNEHFFLSRNSNQRIKRLFHSKSSKIQFNTQQLLKNNQPKSILNDETFFFRNHKEKQTKSETKKGYTQQDLAEIKRILSKKENDYYSILNINTDATRDQIINAYRKLTLLVHPDKIDAPGATEATQKLNKARATLLKKFESQNKVFIVLIIGIIILIIYWKKRQRHSYPLNIEIISKKQKIPPTYDSPESDDGDTINMDENREISINKDEDRINLINNV